MPSPHSTGHNQEPSSSNDNTAECIHTCICLGKVAGMKGKNTDTRYSRWQSYKSHVGAPGRHPECSRSCPGYGAIRNPDSFGEDDFETIRKRSMKGYVHKCSHACICAGSDTAVTFDTDNRTFATEHGAQRHIAGASKHPECTPECPAFQWLGNPAQAEPLALSVDDDNAAVEKVDLAQPTPSRKRPASHRNEESTLVPSNAKKSRLDLSGILIRRPSQSTSLKLIKAPESQAPVYSTSAPLHVPAEIPPLSSKPKDTYDMSSSSIIRPVDYELTGAELVMQYLSALNELCKRLSQISPELQALSMGLYMLPHVNSRNAHFAISGSPTVQSAPDIPAAFVSAISNVMDIVRSASEALGELLQVKDQDGLLETQDPEVRELRRRVARLHDQIVDLRLDLQRAGLRSGVEGLVQEKRRVKEAILKVSTELNDIGGKMKELMVEALNQLPML